MVPLRQGDSDEGKTILLNQCFANHNKEYQIYPLTVKEIVEAQKANSTLKQYFKSGHGKGGKYVPAKMAQLAKCKIAGVSNDGAPHHLISRPLKLVMA